MRIFADGFRLVTGYHALEHADHWVDNHLDDGAAWAGHELTPGLDPVGHFLFGLL